MDKNSPEYRQMLARARERSRALDLADAGLLLQSTIEAGLEAEGKLEPDECVEVSSDASGGLQVKVAKIEPADAQYEVEMEEIHQQLLEADRADASLLVRQTIEASLEADGKLGPDEYVELRKENGVLVPTVKKNNS